MRKTLSLKIINYNIIINFNNCFDFDYFKRKYFDERIKHNKKDDCFIIEVVRKKKTKHYSFILKKNDILISNFLIGKLYRKDLDFLLRVFINFLLLERQVFFFHASSLLLNKNGFVFMGESGAGKSTILKLALKKKNISPLSDDTIILYYKKNNFYIYPSIFDKQLVNKKITRLIKVKTIFFIKKSQKTKIDNLNFREKLRFIKKNLLISEYLSTLKKKDPYLFNFFNKSKIYCYLDIFLRTLVKKEKIFNLNFEKNNNFLKLLK